TVALLLSGVADAGELRGLGCLRRDDRQSGKDIGAVPHVGTDAVELADPADRDGVSAMGHAATHRLEELKKARVALTTLPHARIDALDSHRTAEHGRRRRRIGR